jgi:glucan phosphoethanolaminetransferase (alkaline phosphatase superfamily)
MYDVRDFTGRDEGGSAPPEAMELQYGVPMMVWCSSAFQARYPEQVERLRAAANRKASLDDLPQLLMNLGRVRNSYYRAEHDVLSPKYKEGKRLVRGGVDYDATVSRVKN